MAVSIRFASGSLQDPLLLPQDLGEISPGNQSSVKNYYISHTGSSPIYNCKFYLLPYTEGPYLGSSTAQDDLTTVLGWGDVSHPATSGGGLYINLDHQNGFPTSSWKVFRTGYGDSLSTAVTLPTTAINLGSAIAGQIAASGEAHIRLRWDIPATYTDTGLIYVNLVMYYSETS